MQTHKQMLRLLSAAAAIFPALMPVKSLATDRKPNIVLIVAEDPADTAASKSSHDLTPPHINALAKGGAIFSNGYSSSSEPGPGNAGLLTGRYPQRLGFDANAEGDSARGLDPAQATLAQDLKSAGFSTGVLGQWYLGSGDANLPAARGFDQFQTTGDPTAFIDQHAGDPFFLYLPLTGTDSEIDGAVGAITAKLAAGGLEDNTLVIFVNDKHAAHWTLSEQGIRSPFAISWKGKIAQGQVVDQPVSTLDIAPTILAAAGVAIKPQWHVEGNNLLPFLEGQTNAVALETLYWRLGVQYAVRDSDWKLVKCSADGHPQLFYLDNAALADLDLFKQQAERDKSLQGLWDTWNASNEPPRWVDSRWNGQSSAQADAGGQEGVSGPWKLGDTVPRKQAPNIAQKSLDITADINLTGTDGIVVTQGGTAQGYVIYLTQGKVVFGVRESGDLTTITSQDALGKGHFTVEATLVEDGTLALLVDGKQVAAGKAPGLIPAQPKAGLLIGKAGFGAVGDYQTPDPFEGDVQNVRIKTSASK